MSHQDPQVVLPHLYAGKQPVELPSEDDREVQEHAPAPEPVAAATLLAEHIAMTRRFVVLPDEEAFDVLALWALYTHVWHRFWSTPYLRVFSSELRCGKTRVLETAIEPWVRRPYVSVGGSSAAFLRRTVDKKHPVLLIDESDGWMKDPEKAESIRGILNSGFTRGKPYGLIIGNEPVELDVFCPKVIAGIGEVSETVEDRSIKIPMRRKRREEQVWPFDGAAAAQLESIASVWRTRAQRWASDAHTDGVRPSYPEVVVDRVRDVWRPLFVVATIAGGEWPDRVSRAAEVLERPRVETERRNVGTLILRDLHELWVEQGKPDFLATQDILTHLSAQHERPWADWQMGMTAERLAKNLKPYGVASSRTRLIRGYKVDSLHDAWARYL